MHFLGKNGELGECIGFGVAKRFSIGKNFSFYYLYFLIVFFYESGNKTVLVCGNFAGIFPPSLSFFDWRCVWEKSQSKKLFFWARQGSQSGFWSRVGGGG